MLLIWGCSRICLFQERPPVPWFTEIEISLLLAGTSRRGAGTYLILGNQTQAGRILVEYCCFVNHQQQSSLKRRLEVASVIVILDDGYRRAKEISFASHKGQTPQAAFEHYGFSKSLSSSGRLCLISLTVKMNFRLGIVCVILNGSFTPSITRQSL